MAPVTTRSPALRRRQVTVSQVMVMIIPAVAGGPVTPVGDAWPVPGGGYGAGA
jgi:hypothetical protein